MIDLDVIESHIESKQFLDSDVATLLNEISTLGLSVEPMAMSRIEHGWRTIPELALLYWPVAKDYKTRYGRPTIADRAGASQEALEKADAERKRASLALAQIQAQQAADWLATAQAVEAQRTAMIQFQAAMERAFRDKAMSDAILADNKKWHRVPKADARHS